MTEALWKLVRDVADELRGDLERLSKQAASGADAGQLDTGPLDTERLDTGVRECLDRHLARLAASQCWGPANRAASQWLWQAAGAFLRVGSLQYHAYSKPRGYAGDFEMLDRICHETCSSHPLGASFDRYFLQQAAPRAVRRRVERVSRTIVDRVRQSGGAAQHMVSVGSGPAFDVERALGQLSAKQRATIRVTLLDLDPRALEHAAAQIGPLLEPHSLACVHANLSRLTRQAANRRRIESADLLFCTGFFDYVDDLAATELLGLFWRSLAPQGRMAVYNFAPSNPSRAYMEWIGNWYLTYRDAPTLVGLGRAAGIPNDCLESVAISDGNLVELTAWSQ